MTWNGEERRKDKVQGFCTQHIEFAKTMAHIETSVINIEKSIEHATTFKTGIIISLVGIIFAIILQIATFSYLYGQLNKQVEVNTLRLNVLEKLAVK